MTFEASPTVHARNVLADCEHALADFEAGEGTEYRRTRWVALITLLRTVGHVLFAVDRPLADPATQRRIDRAWDHLKTSRPAIFWDFIDAERQNTVHIYEVTPRANITFRPGAGRVRINASGPEPPADEGGPTTWNYFMRSGPFKGHDPCELAREAIQFWRDYLDDIDRKGAASRTEWREWFADLLVNPPPDASTGRKGTPLKWITMVYVLTVPVIRKQQPEVKSDHAAAILLAKFIVEEWAPANPQRAKRHGIRGLDVETLVGRIRKACQPKKQAQRKKPRKKKTPTKAVTRPAKKSIRRKKAARAI